MKFTVFHLDFSFSSANIILHYIRIEQPMKSMVTVWYGGEVDYRKYTAAQEIE